MIGGASDIADFFGHPYGHPLTEPYYSQAPMRWGGHVAKLAAFPVTDQDSLSRWKLDQGADENGFRDAAVAHFVGNDMVFELRVQLRTDAESQPIEDASVEWSTDESPYRTAAIMRIPRQEAYGHERVRYFDERMTFRSAHSLAAHRPLGSIMRARLRV